MPRGIESHLTECPRRQPARRAGFGTRLSPRLESLECRCLLSTWYSTSGAHHHQLASYAATGQVQSTRTIEPAHEYDHASTSGADQSAYKEGSYLVIPEGQAPHGTMKSAQALPDFPFFGVIGDIAPGETTDFYRIWLPSTNHTIGLGLISMRGSEAPLQIHVYDGSGRLLAEAVSSPQGGLPSRLELGDLTPGSTVYLGISSSASRAASADGAIGYQLWVGLQSSGRTADAKGADSASASSPATISTLGTAAGSGTIGPASSVGSTPAATIFPTAAGRTLAVTGSAEIRSARPYGGIFSSDDSSSSQIDRDLGAGSSGPWADRTIAGTEGARSEPTVLIRDPGGFPLLGASPIGHRREALGESRVKPVILPSVEDQAPQVDEGHESPWQNIPAELLAREIEQESIARNRAWGGFPFSIFSSLGLATTMTLNAVLSQPLAGFDYLTARLDIRPGRSKPLGRPRRQRP